jgi:hypothetical protein
LTCKLKESSYLKEFPKILPIEGMNPTNMSYPSTLQRTPSHEFMSYSTQHIHTTILQFTMGMGKNQARKWNQVTSLISTLVLNNNKDF